MQGKHVRTQSTCSGLSIVDLNEDQDNREWTYFSNAQSIPSALNDPHVGRAQTDQIFIRDWGFAFTETPTPVSTNRIVRRAQFDAYLKHLRSRVKYQKQLLNTIDKISATQKNGYTENQSPKKAVKPINLENIVPSIFLKEELQLNNFLNFKRVLAQSDDVDFLLSQEKFSVGSQGVPFSIAVKNLEQRLTDYLDLVEEHLARQISARFRDFFHIMSAMDMVMEQLSTTIQEVGLVRQKCSKLQQTLVFPVLKNIQLTKRREHLQAVYEKLRVMATVHETQPTIQYLLSSSDYVGALDLISTTQEVYAADLNGLNSFRHLQSQLYEIRNVIDQMMQEDFVKFTTNEWNRPLTEEEQKYIVSENGKNVVECTKDVERNDDRLSCMILGMLRVQRMNFVDVFREEACMTIKAVVKQTLIEILAREEDIEDKSDNASPFDQLNALDFRKWRRLLATLFDNLFIVLKRIEIVYTGILKTIHSITLKKDIESSTSEVLPLNQNIETGRFLEKQDATKLCTQLKECFDYICDYCQSQCASLVETRAREGSFSKISFAEFVELVKMIENFTFKCERVCDRKSASLKLVLQAQTNSFVTRFHDERKKKLMSMLDIEQWKSYEAIPPDFQQMLSDLLDYHRSIYEIGSTRKQEINGIEKQKPLSYIKLGEQKFVIVSSIITLVQMIIEYCTCASEIGVIAPDLLSRLIDLLRQFNARVSQLVYCAEAIQVAGLKTITSRNLLISSRCLMLVLVLLPYIKNHFDALLTAKHKQMLKHLEETKRAYLEHIHKINEKVIFVVRTLIANNVNKWEAKPPVPSSQFKTISQHLQRLYLNVEDTLPEEELEQFFGEIHEIFKSQLRKQLNKLKIVNDGGPQHGLVTQELTFYKESLKIAKQKNFSWDDLWTCN